MLGENQKSGVLADAGRRELFEGARNDSSDHALVGGRRSCGWPFWVIMRHSAASRLTSR